MGKESAGISLEAVRFVAHQVAALDAFEIAIVVGGGNFFRGRDFPTLTRVKIDRVGMLATVMNGIILAEGIAEAGRAVRVVGPDHVSGCVEAYRSSQASSWLREGKVVICTGGTGVAFFTTDTAAVLRACELDCDVVLKGTPPDGACGIYSADPKKDAGATFFPRITYEDAIARKLGVMDATAFALARENRVPIIVFSLRDAIASVLAGACQHTIVVPDEK